MLDVLCPVHEAADIINLLRQKTSSLFQALQILAAKLLLAFDVYLRKK